MKSLCERPLVALLLAIVSGVSGCDRKKAVYVPPPPPEVTVASPERRTVPITLELTGTTRGVEAVEVRARVKGFLQKKLVEGGRRVKAGELLFEIDPRTFEAVVRESEAELSTRKANKRLADVTVERIDRAAKANAASQQELDKATADRDAAQAQVELAEARLQTAKLDLEFTKVRSPINGRLGIVPIDEGTLVGASEPTLLATVINDEKVYAVYDIDERTVLGLRKLNENRRPGEDGRPNLKIRLGMTNETGYPHLGEFHKADNTVNTGTGTVRVEAIFDNADGTILPGSFVRIQPILGERDALMVPDVAVLQDQSGRYVLIVGADGVVERVPVRATGPSYARLLPIEEVLAEPLAGSAGASGQPAKARLSADTAVIVNGLQRARPGEKVTVKRVAATEAPAGKSAGEPGTKPEAKPLGKSGS